MRIIVCLLAALAVGGPGVLAVTKGCPAPPLIPVASLVKGKSSIKAACKNLLKSKEVVSNYISEKRDFLKTDGRVGETDCLYSDICKTKEKIIENWQISGTSCWNIEPIKWITCKSAKDKPFFQCQPKEEGVGYTCHEEYVYQTIWACCGTSKSDATILPMTVPVSVGCNVNMYNCGDDPGTEKAKKADKGKKAAP